MSHALEAVLDETEIIGDAYVLEVSSPGLSRSLTTDREFVTFKGFPVSISTTEPHNGQQEWSGQLIKRDDAAVHINRKGRAIVIPRPLITTVQLVEAQE
jgi:ribosome maturation factor RimP